MPLALMGWNDVPRVQRSAPLSRGSAIVGLWSRPMTATTSSMPWPV